LEITDAALLPSGDLLILECSFSWPEGLLGRIRRIPLSAIRPNALVDGPVLIGADLGEEIDYLDGLSVHRATNDNFSPLTAHTSLAIHAAGSVISLPAESKQVGRSDGTG
jgi:hypothetical protein